MTTTKRVTVATLKALKPGDSLIELKDSDVQGGYIYCRPGTGTLSYVVRYRINGQPTRKVTIGRFDPDAGGLAEARRRAREALAQRDRGIDPRQAKRKAKEAARQRDEPPGDTVADVVEKFIKLHVEPHNKDVYETTRILRKEITGRWGKRRLSEVTSADVRAMMRDVAARGAPIAANRIFGRLRALCNWAVQQEIITAAPTDRVRAISPEKGRARERVLDDRELALVWRAAETLGYPFGPIYQILILTGQRRGEVAGMRWDELDLAKGLWTIPAARSKNGLMHTVALTESVLEVLRALPRFSREPGQADFVFSPQTTAPSGWSRAKSRLDAALEEPMPDFVVHDIRRSVASGMARIGVGLPVIEKCLNQVSGSFGGIVGVYQRHSFEAETRDAWTRWAAHVVANV